MAETIKIGGELESTATGNVVAAASAIKDKVKNKYQGEINAETDATLANHASAIQGLNSQNYVTVTATDQTMAVTDVLPATGSTDTIYRVGSWDGTQYDETCYSEYSWNGSAYVHISTKTQIGEVFDISAYHATGGTLATYADLSAALDSNNGGGVPQSLQKGGMSVKYVRTSDNKYVQYFLPKNTWSASASYWEKENLEENVSFSGNVLPNIDSQLGILDLGSDPNLYVGNRVYIAASFESEDDYRAIKLQGVGSYQDSGRRKLVFNINSKKFRTLNCDAPLSPDEVLIGAFVTQYSMTGYIAGSFKSANLPFEYTIDGKRILEPKIEKRFLQRIEVTGKGDTGIKTDFELVPNTKYKILLSNTNWDISGVSSWNGIFSIGYTDYNNVTHDLVYIDYNSRPQGEYTLTAIDAKNYYIFIRATQNEKVYFGIVPLSSADKSGIGFTPTIGQLPNIDTNLKILDLGEDPVLYIGDISCAFASIFSSNPEYYRSIPIYDAESSTGAVKLLFNLSTKRLYVKANSYIIKNDEVVIGAFRLRYQSHNFLSANLPFEYTIDGKRPWEGELYEGEPLPIGNRFNKKLLFSLSSIGTPTYSVDTQGMDIYNDKYLFQGNAAGQEKSIFVLDLEQRLILGSFLFTESGDWHMNNINCAEKENDSDKFPLIYLSECYGEHRCAVIKINDSANDYEVKQIISFQTSQHYLGGTLPFDWFIDKENGFIYCYGMATSSRGPVELVKFNLSQYNNTSVIFTDNDVVESFIVEGIGVYQGSKMVNGKLLCPVGLGDDEWPSFIKVIDLFKKKIVTSLPLNNGEIEAVAIYNGGLVIVDSSTNPYYYLITI